MNPPATTQQHVLAWLRRAIVAGELRPGQKVAQDAVAAQTGVSVVPVREALGVLESEGQLTYLPRRGYYVTELRIEDLVEIYELRRLLEARAVRHALGGFDAEALERLERAARDCVRAGAAGEIAVELEANRRLHFALFEAPGQPHLLRVIRGLWDATEPYRALYYNDELERDAAGAAHERILDAVRARALERLIAELDAHRDRALAVLRGILAGAAVSA